MSGKKKSDVTSVLKNADGIRKDLFDKQFSEYARRVDDFKKHSGEMTKKSLENSENISDEEKAIRLLKKRLDSTNRRIQELNEQMKKTADDDAISREEWYNRSLDEQYHQAKKLIEDYSAISDEIKKVNQSVSRKIDSLKEEIYKEEQRTLALSKIEAIQDQISSISYINPSNNEKMSFEAASLYHLNSTESYTKIIQNLTKLTQSVNSGNTQIDKILKDIVVQISELEEELDEKTIDAKEAIQTAYAIADALYETGYDYHINPSGESIHDGITVITKEPAELVFSLKNVIEHQNDGSEDEVLKVEFNVDNAPGSCSVRAGSLAKKLRASGIDFQITDWGIASNPSKNTTQSQSSFNGSVSSNV